ncbi:ubiquitin carboxyl-terminal hydrolase 15 [Pelomyxa schiedti]|nr:ubiquitin carboxyl-terminal hydrolase 15 [Pelomyxa schiedti]
MDSDRAVQPSAETTTTTQVPDPDLHNNHVVVPLDTRPLLAHDHDHDHYRDGGASPSDSDDDGRFGNVSSSSSDDDDDGGVAVGEGAREMMLMTTAGRGRSSAPAAAAGAGEGSGDSEGDSGRTSDGSDGDEDALPPHKMLVRRMEQDYLIRESRLIANADGGARGNNGMNGAGDGEGEGEGRGVGPTTTTTTGGAGSEKFEETDWSEAIRTEPPKDSSSSEDEETSKPDEIPAQPASPEDERKIIKDLILENRMKEGEDWFLIAAPWYRRWKSYTRYETYYYSSLSQAPKPGPIDNSGLLVEGANAQNMPIVKRECTEMMDYELLPRPVWKLLQAWYSGGPEIARKVIRIQGYWSSSLTVEVKLLCVNLVKSSEITTPLKVYTSKRETVGNFRKLAVEWMKLESENVKLWDYHGETKIKELTDLTTTLEAAQIIDHQLVLLEEKNADGTWPDPPKPKPVSTFADVPRMTQANESPTRHNPYANMWSNSQWGGGYYSRPPEAPGLVGLQNLGNTCFMNSALQCLSNTAVLTNFFLSNEWVTDLNTNNPLGLGGKLAQEYAALVKQLWQGNSSVVVPRDFKSKLEMFAPQFQGYQQHDSQELLAFLLDGLHEDLNRVKVKPYNPIPSLEGDSDVVAADKMWKLHSARNQSFIVDNFQGQLKSTVVCPQCKKISVTFDPFMFLSLPIPITSQKSIFILLHTIASPIPVRYGIQLMSDSSINTLKDALSLLCNIPPDRICLCDTSSHKIKELAGDETIEGLYGDVYGFEVIPKSEHPDYVNICILQRKTQLYTYTKYSYTDDYMSSWRNNGGVPTYTTSIETRKNHDFFGIPLVMSVPKHITYDSLCGMVAQRLFFYLNLDSFNYWLEEHTENTPLPKGIVGGSTNPFDDDYSSPEHYDAHHKGKEDMSAFGYHPDDISDTDSDEGGSDVDEQITGEPADVELRDLKGKEEATDGKEEGELSGRGEESGEDQGEAEQSTIKQKHDPPNRPPPPIPSSSKKSTSVEESQNSIPNTTIPACSTETNPTTISDETKGTSAEKTTADKDESTELSATTTSEGASGGSTTITTDTNSTVNTVEPPTDSQQTEQGTQGQTVAPTPAEELLRKIFTLKEVDDFADQTAGIALRKRETIELCDGFMLGVCWKPNKNDIYQSSKGREYTKHPSANINPWSKDSTAVTLDECLDLFTSIEKLTANNPWFCPVCKSDQQATKKFDLWKLPPVLVVHLKRFSQKNRYWRDRLDTDVNFPVDGLDMSKRILSNTGESLVYDLYAVSNHMGSMSGGHYTAYAKNKDSNKWFNFDDSSVSHTAANNISHSMAYVLFYKLRGFCDTPAVATATTTEEPKPETESSEETPEEPSTTLSTTTATTTTTTCTTTSTTTTTTTAEDSNDTPSDNNPREAEEPLSHIIVEGTMDDTPAPKLGQQHVTDTIDNNAL